MVEPRQNCSGSVHILCRLLSRFEGAARCEILYSTILSSSNTENIHTDTSESVGSAEDILSIALSISYAHDVIISVKAYTVGGKQDAIIEGTFEIGNYKSNILLEVTFKK